MKIAYAWYYLPTGRKQHVVRESELTEFPCITAICGCQVLSVLPSRARWQNDADGLQSRDKCRACANILEKEQTE